MKNIRFFKTRCEMEDFVASNIICKNEFRENKFYKNLVKFVINERAPIFYDNSRDYEWAHFTQYFNFVLLRKNYYDNRYIEDLYYLHDFVHMIFDNPFEVREYPFSEFERVVNINEFVASMETEVMTYYRLPHIRSKTFDKKNFLRLP